MQHAVLIVDDEPRIFSALRRALHRENYELLPASNADEALKILGDRRVDVIIADENMPGMSGSVLLARVRQQWPSVVRMMLTGDARLETVVAAVNRGEIYRFFIKPCNEVELIVSIRDALKSRDPEPTESSERPTREPAVVHLAGAKEAPKPIDLNGTPDEIDNVKAENTGSVFKLEGDELNGNVDHLLDEIRTELEKLDS